MNDIRSIDTFYNNNYFRSRLEARWAVFFDELGIKYLYEPEGFILPDGAKYLPDFWLPEFECYAEVKPDDKGYYYLANGHYRFHQYMLIEHPDFKKWTQVKKPILMLIGNPHTHSLPLLNRWEEHICDVGFYREFKRKIIIDGVHVGSEMYWRFWIGNGDEDYDDHKEAAEIANKTRFEFNK